VATILVADDDQLLRAILRDHFEDADHGVLEAGDGIAALEIALDERPDVLLLDVMMPLARGLEVARQVRREEGWHPVIVMISARTRVTDRLNALEAGADAYVEKPFAPDDLLFSVERLLSDAPPARYVDVLGPVWATLAIERLAKGAMERRTAQPVETDHFEELFTDVVARSLGRMPVIPAPAMNAATSQSMRLLWEDAIRALLRDTAEPVPVVTDVSLPDALAAVEHAIVSEALRRRRSHLGGPTVDVFWTDVITDALFDRPDPPAQRPEPATPIPTLTPTAWSERLRDVLGHVDPADDVVDKWVGVLAKVITTTEPAGAAVPTIDPLEVVWLSSATRALDGERAG
jgi:DNA-binding response OmpR family regulator